MTLTWQEFWLSMFCVTAFLAIAWLGWRIDTGHPTATDLARERARRYLALRRKHCCAKYRKPCTLCQNYEDGLLDMVEWVEFHDPEHAR